MKRETIDKFLYHNVTLVDCHFMTETSTYHVRLTQRTYGMEWALKEGELNEHLREND